MFFKLALRNVRRSFRDYGVYLLTLTDGTTLLLSHGLDVFRAGRRELQHETRTWESLVTCTPGHPLVVRPPGGGPVVEYAPVRVILVVEG